MCQAGITTENIHDFVLSLPYNFYIFVCVRQCKEEKSMSFDWLTNWLSLWRDVLMWRKWKELLRIQIGSRPTACHGFLPFLYPRPNYSIFTLHFRSRTRFVAAILLKKYYYQLKKRWGFFLTIELKHWKFLVDVHASVDLTSIEMLRLLASRLVVHMLDDKAKNKNKLALGEFW